MLGAKRRGKKAENSREEIHVPRKRYRGWSRPPPGEGVRGGRPLPPKRVLIQAREGEGGEIRKGGGRWGIGGEAKPKPKQSPNTSNKVRQNKITPKWSSPSQKKRTPFGVQFSGPTKTHTHVVEKTPVGNTKILLPQIEGCPPYQGRFLIQGHPNGRKQTSIYKPPLIYARIRA